MRDEEEKEREDEDRDGEEDCGERDVLAFLFPAREGEEEEAVIVGTALAAEP
tara:strand:- start:153 stop:308 length:156 start_codon:yes stop_codon:yes gene_type:complete